VLACFAVRPILGFRFGSAIPRCVEPNLRLSVDCRASCSAFFPILDRRLGSAFRLRLGTRLPTFVACLVFRSCLPLDLRPSPLTKLGAFPLNLTVDYRLRCSSACPSVRPLAVALDRPSGLALEVCRRPCYLGCHSRVARVSPTGVSPSMPMLSNILGYSRDFLLSARSAALTEWSRYPEYATPASYHTYSVWPVPLSLTTTQGIAVAFSSCGY